MRRASIIRRAALWIMNLSMATTPEATRPLSVWDREVVVRDRRSQRKLAVIRNDSSGSEDRVTSALEDVDQLSASSFAELYL